MILSKLKKSHALQKFLLYLTNHLIANVFVTSWRMFWYRNVMRFQIGKDSSILVDFRVSRKGHLSIGKNTVINNGCRFDNRFPIEIGDNVSISYGVHILTKGHDMDDPDFKTHGAGIVIEDYAWICTNAVILPGVRLGKGSVVLTGAVVTKDVPPYHVVGGNPARFIRERTTDLRYQLKYDAWVPFWG